jgi:hypothetical protein
MIYGEPRYVEGQVEADDLSADVTARAVENLVDELVSRQQPDPLAVRSLRLFRHNFTENRQIFSRQNLGFVKGPALEKPPLVAELIGSEPNALVGRRSGFAIEDKDQSLGGILGGYCF